MLGVRRRRESDLCPGPDHREGEDAGADGQIHGWIVHRDFPFADGRGFHGALWRGRSIGFRDAQLIKVSDQRELNFLLAPFLSRQVPSSMKVDAADLLRKALEGSTATSGYKVTLERLKVHSMQIEGTRWWWTWMEISA